MSLDQHGCILSTENPEVVQIVNQFSSELLRLGKRMDVILDGVARYPEEVILHIYAAIFYLYAQTEETQRKANDHLDQASHLIAHANEREKNLFSVAWHWLNQLMSDALKDVERHCFKWPKDLTALKIAEFLFYCKGQKYESSRFLRLTTQCFHDLQNNPFFLSIHSFALELSGKYDESLQTAERALKLNEENPWAHHTLSHLYLNKGLIDEGIVLLEGYAKRWNQFNHIIESHNLWHLALLYLENLDFEKAEAIYQRADWVHQTQLVSEEIDAAAFLWRLDLEGRGHPDLWKHLAETIGDKANFGGMPFASVQLCYALKKGERTEALNTAIENIQSLAHEQVKEDRYVWREVGLPLIAGSLAYADGDFSQAVRHFDPIMDTVGCVGGSDAQIDLFYQTYLKSLIGAHRDGDAESLLHHMTQGRNLTKLERKWLSECHGNNVPLQRAV